MIFKHPVTGTIRTKTRFLLFPRRICSITKWLEIASWTEEYTDCTTSGYWYPRAWITNSFAREYRRQAK